jgi:exodeoxyribonuclease V beta subunit
VHEIAIPFATELESTLGGGRDVGGGGEGRPRRGVGEGPDVGDAVLDFTPTDKDDQESQWIEATVQYETLAERIRLLYVAATRAVQRCYLTAGVYAMPQGRSVKESVRSLGNWLVAGNGGDFRAFIANDLDSKAANARAASIVAAWNRLATRAAPNLAIVPLPGDAGAPLLRPPISPAVIVASTPPAPITDVWRIGSFSALAQGTARDIAAADHDARVDARDETEPAEPAPPDDIVRFPRGAAAGECLHAILERIDFADSREWPTTVAAALVEFPPGRSEVESARLAPMVERMLHDVTSTPLPIGGTSPPVGATLASVARARRLSELGFTFPARALDATRLRDTVVAAGYPMPRLAPERLHGYLSGYVDLVFEHDGRYYVLDWKSNHLGHRAADYANDAVARTMRDHGYHLQQLIYSVALDRYLRRRVPRYDRDAHFGGVLYVFVRGLRPAWRTADGTQTGVYFDRPSAGTLERVAVALGATVVERQQ